MAARAGLAGLVIDLGPLREGRGFRIVFAVRLISLFGGGFRLVALPLQVYAMTGSSVLVASVAVVNGLAGFGGTLVGGVLADRLDRRRLTVFSLAVETVVVALFAVNTYLPGGPELWVVYLCAAVNGVIGTMGLIAQQTLVPALVGPGRLAAAGALLALTAQFGAVTAPALGGALVSLGGVGAGYLITCGITAVAAAAAWFLPPVATAPGAERVPAPRAMAEGLAFVARHPVVRPLLLLGFVQVLFTMPAVLIPEFTDRVLGADAAVAGLLYTAPAAGALLASLSSGWTGRVRRGGAVVPAAVALGGAFVAAVGLGRTAAVALVALALLGCCQAVEEILRYALIQSHTPDALRGRVNSAWLAQATVGGSLGATLMGALAAALGTAAALAVAGGAGALAAAAIALTAPGLRRAGEGAPALPDTTPDC
ncbi:enterobactin transporter EntS [Streptomonospora nanhaiensis]|uniref:Multidrug efflux pump Tap n=1 Tax=Streptomonospora nanhaiensis TaxID=1323731 RepID=A0A853BER6_9ACTN|nr:enterobactin transporter EntS [Streptomonospora nanhaiensis]NYI93928.1 ENTS family enterobactin (siderophore) exporter [Streptomonospora nanhaiensis]